MKAVVADKIADFAVEELRTICSEVRVDPSLSAAALAEACAGAQVLVVRSTRVQGPVFDAARGLELIVRGGAGVNTIDVARASAEGVFVANCLGRNAEAVAELAVGLMVSLDRRIPDNVIAIREGRWDKKRFARAAGLAGRCVGVVGLGRIGQAFLARVRAFGMKPIAWSRSLSDARAEALGVERMSTVEALLERADVVSLHLALTPGTRGLLDRERIGLLKDGALLINTARAGLVDQGALVDAVRDRGIRVGLDVIEEEPASKSGPLETVLAGLPGVYVTHHIGASTEQAQEAVAAEVVRIVRAFAESGEVPNCVNVCARSPATHQVMVRHRDRVGVLADVLGAVSRHGLNVEEMENVVFEGARAACATLRLAAAPSADLVAAIADQPDVLGVTIQDL